LPDETTVLLRQKARPVICRPLEACEQPPPCNPGDIVAPPTIPAYCFVRPRSPVLWDGWKTSSRAFALNLRSGPFMVLNIERRGDSCPEDSMFENARYCLVGTSRQPK
jgi:hypothetical protein